MPITLRKSAKQANAQISKYFHATRKRKPEEFGKGDENITRSILLDHPYGERSADVLTRPALKKMRLQKSAQQQPSETATDLGFFSHFPPELVFYLFDRIPVSSIGRLCTASKAVCRLGWLYFEARSTVRRFDMENHPIERPMHCYTCNIAHGTELVPPRSYKQWGFLLKMLTVMLPTEKRIEVVRRFFEDHRQPDVGRSEALLSGWGQLFMAVVRNWPSFEMNPVFRHIVAHNDALTFRDQFLTSAPGQNPDLEFQLRIFYRKVFLDHDFANTWDKPLWLSMILRGLTPEEQGKLLALLCVEGRYVPKRSFRITWRSVCDVAVTTYESAVRRLKDYTELLSLLANPKIRYSWTAHAVFMLVEELTTFPEPWAMDNFAALLLLAPQVGKTVLEVRISSGHVAEAALICSAMKNLIRRWSRKNHVLTGLLEGCLKKCGSRQVRIRFLGEFWEASLERDQELSAQPHMQNLTELEEERQGFELADAMFRATKNVKWGK